MLRAMNRARTWLLVAPLLLGACFVDEIDPEEESIELRCLSGGGVGLIGLDLANVSGTPTITGAYPSVFSNTDVELAGSFSIAGKAISGKTVTISGNKTPAGGIVEHAGTITVSDPTAEVAAAASKNDNAKIPCVKSGSKCNSPVKSGVLTLSGTTALTLPAGNYYLTGVAMSGRTKLNVSGTVVIYLAGGATFNGGSATNPSSDSLTLVSSSTQDVKINGGGTTSMYVFAPKAAVRFAGTSGFKGTALGKELHVSGTASLEITANLGITGTRTTCTPADTEDPGEAIPDLPR
jgi:hypothetical protein